MSSWVAPAVAAEICGISVEQVMRHIADGTVPSRSDGRFLFVDVAALGMKAATQPPGDSGLLVSSQELLALAAPASADADQPPDISQWREARSRTSQQRRAPAEGAA